MLANTPPLGWNSWNTFGDKINEQLIFEMADRMVADGYLAAGYEYLVIDDCWSLKERNAEGRLQADPVKFPHGMKAVADYVHSKGLKFGMYSCSGVRTCAGYPASFDHEYTDAETFASWGVDFLKYDFCHFPDSADCRTRYQTMSMALKATGRPILFSACNWGERDSWRWMNSVGAHMFRSTGDIMDNFVSFTEIFKSQLDKFCTSGVGCFNDMDMLTVGMNGKGNVGLNWSNTYEEYRMQFALWCLAGSPLMIGADLRILEPRYAELMKNPTLLRIDQDEECRPVYLVRRTGISVTRPDPKDGEYPWMMIPDTSLVMFRHLSDNEFALAYVNMGPKEAEIACELADLGVPVTGGVALEMTDVFTGECIGRKKDSFDPRVPSHDMKLYLCKLVRES